MVDGDVDECVDKGHFYRLVGSKHLLGMPHASVYDRWFVYWIS